MAPQQAAAAAAAAAAAMGQNFVLFPFLDQLHHASAAAAAAGAFHNPLQSMQPFMQKNNVSHDRPRSDRDGINYED